MSKGTLLGFEVPVGEPYYMPLHHLVCSGMTSLSGKTTTLEALISRSGLRALVFKTKRGEKGFEQGNHVPIFFREKCDWQYVSSLIEATLREKTKFERSWIIKACKGARSLKDVQANVLGFLESKKIRGIDESVYTNLNAYLDLVLPILGREKFSTELQLEDGLNVMDLTRFYNHAEVQALIIRSVMEEVLEHEEKLIIVMPEGWKFLPQGRGTPVKVFFEQFIREGAILQNYLWLDTQDLGGLDKTPLRQVDNWIMGRMKETHEVERLIKSLPVSKSEKPDPLIFQTMKRGHFFAACGNDVKLVYVLPNGVPEDVGRRVAVGELEPERVWDYVEKEEDDDVIWKEKYQQLEKEKKLGDSYIKDLVVEVEQWRVKGPKLEAQIRELEENLKNLTDEKERLEATLDLVEVKLKRFETLEKALSDVVNVTLVSKPTPEAIVTASPTLTSVKCTVDVAEETRHIGDYDTTTLEGRILRLAAEGQFEQWRSLGEVTKLLEDKGWGVPKPTLQGALRVLAKEKGLLGWHAEPKRGTTYKRPEDVEFRKGAD